jgi:hypothetical protein
VRSGTIAVERWKASTTNRKVLRKLMERGRDWRDWKQALGGLQKLKAYSQTMRITRKLHESAVQQFEETSARRAMKILLDHRNNTKHRRETNATADFHWRMGLQYKVVLAWAREVGITKAKHERARTMSVSKEMHSMEVVFKSWCGWAFEERELKMAAGLVAKMAVRRRGRRAWEKWNGSIR